MYKSQKVAVVMPAYNAERTLRETYHGVVEQNIADIRLSDRVEVIAEELPLIGPGQALVGRHRRHVFVEQTVVDGDAVDKDNFHISGGLNAG